MKKIFLVLVFTLPLFVGCYKSMLCDGSYSNEYEVRVIGHVSADGVPDRRLYIIKIDDVYYYATYASSWNIGPVVPERALRRHKERLDF